MTRPVAVLIFALCVASLLAGLLRNETNRPVITVEPNETKKDKLPPSTDFVAEPDQIAHRPERVDGIPESFPSPAPTAPLTVSDPYVELREQEGRNAQELIASAPERAAEYLRSVEAPPSERGARAPSEEELERNPYYLQRQEQQTIDQQPAKNEKLRDYLDSTVPFSNE